MLSNVFSGMNLS